MTSFVAGAREQFVVDGAFSGDGTREIKGANIYVEDSLTGDKQTVDSIYLTVTDADDNQQYLLTTLSTPAITIEAGPVYVVEAIDVTGFPTGNIILEWTAEVDGYTVTDTQTVIYGDAPSIIVLSGTTEKLQDYSAVIGQAKTYTVKLQDPTGNRTDGYNTRLVLVDDNTSTVVERVSGTLQAIGSGLWAITHILTSTLYNGDLYRYQMYWDVQIESGGSWYEVEGTRNRLKVFNTTSSISAAPLSFCSVDDVRKTFPFIDEFLSRMNSRQGDREVVLQNVIYSSALEIHSNQKYTKARSKPELLRQLNVWSTVHDVMITAQSFMKFGESDRQLKEIKRKIANIKLALYSHNRMIQIGPI